MAKNKMADVMKMERNAKKALAEDIKAQLEAAKKAQQDKLASSKDHLKAQLEVTAEKYMTVNGYMQARSALEDSAFGVTEGADDFPEIARSLALEISDLAGNLAKSLDAIDVMELDDSFLESYLDMEFVKTAHSIVDTASQLLVINLLQNLGPAIGNIIEFREATQAEIDHLSTIATTEE